MNIRFATLEIYVFDEITERFCNVLHFLLMVLGFSWVYSYTVGNKTEKMRLERLRLEYDDVFVLVLRTVRFVDFFIMFL